MYTLDRLKLKKTHKTKNTYSEWNNRRHKILSPEDMVIGKEYTFTVNPQIQPYTKNGIIDMISWHNEIHNIFGTMTNCTIKLNLELSQGSRFHYHGTIIIKDIMKFFIKDLMHLREHSSFEIDEITDKEVWDKYCCKQKTIMEKYCKESLVPYTYDNTKPMRIKVNPLNTENFNNLIKLEQDEDTDSSGSE